MLSEISLGSATAFLGVMLAGASLPTISTLIVVSRSSSSGFIHGAAASAGIVLGDLIFILIAVLGLALLAETLGDYFVAVKYAAGAYLVVLGVMIFRSKISAKNLEERVSTSLISSFMAGFLVTLADQKAILFYLGIFPAIFNLPDLTLFDVGLIVIIAIIGVGSPKLIYAYFASKAKMLISAGLHKKMNITISAVLIGLGLYLILQL